ncbi:MAG: histidine phosphatase family protein [Coprococcus catus]
MRQSFASPLVREENQAAIVSGRTFEEVQPDARIREMDFGVDEGKPYSLIKDLFDRGPYIPPEGPSIEAADPCTEIPGYAVRNGGIR